MASFAYCGEKVVYAWDVDEIPESEREKMKFYDRLYEGAQELLFRRDHVREGSRVRATFYYPSGTGGGGESLTHLLFKNAFLEVDGFDTSLMRKGAYLPTLKIQNAVTELPVFIGWNRALRIDVVVEVSQPGDLVAAWGARLGIEVKCSNEVPIPKAETLYEHRIPCIEIEVPNTLEIDDSELLNWDVVAAHTEKCKAYISSHRLECDVLSKPVREDYMRDIIAQLRQEKQTSDLQLKQRSEEVAELKQKLSASEEACRVLVSRSETAQMDAKAKDTKIAQLALALKKSKERTFWKRVLNAD